MLEATNERHEIIVANPLKAAAQNLGLFHQLPQG